MPHSPEYFHNRFGSSHQIETCFCYYFSVFYYLLCFWCRGWRKIIPKYIFCGIFHRTLVRRSGNHCLHVHRRFPCGGWTNTIQAINDFCINFSPVFVLLSFADTAQFSAVLEQAGAAVNKRFSRIYLLLPPLGLWGLGYFEGNRILARFMAADSVKSLIKSTPY